MAGAFISPLGCPRSQGRPDRRDRRERGARSARACGTHPNSLVCEEIQPLMPHPLGNFGSAPAEHTDKR